MYPSRDSILRKYLGSINCGPCFLTAQQKFVIFTQTVEYLVNTDPALKGAIPSEFSNVPMLGQIMQMAPYNRCFSDDLISNIARTKNISRQEVTELIAKDYYLLTIESLFSNYVPQVGYSTQIGSSFNHLELSSGGCPPGVPRNFSIGSSVFEYYFHLQYSTRNRDFMTGEVFYINRNTNEYFSINICYRVHNEYGLTGNKHILPGYQLRTSFLLNADIMVDNTDKPIIVFQDKIIARILNDNIYDLPFIPSSYNLDLADCTRYLSDLQGRSVILVPLSQIKSYISMLTLGKEIQDKYMALVTICNYSIFPSNSFSINPSITDEEYAIQEIVEHARSVQDINWDTFLSDEEHLLRPDQYESWLQKIGLYNNFEPQKNIAPLSYSDLSSVSSYDDSTKDLHDILSPGTVSFCYGPSTAGKSIWALTLALSFSCGFNVFNLSSIKKNKVLYIDYETSSGRFKYNLEQLIDAYEIDQTILDKNFKFMLKTVNPDIQHIWDNKQSTSWFHNICDNIKKDGVKLVIIYTLTRAAPNSPQSSSQAAAFIEYMIDVSTQLDLAILILHHANKNGDMKGSSDLFNGATNVFQLEKVKQSSEGSGAKLKVTYSKVKTAPHLENRPTHYRLQFKNNDKVHPWEKYNPEESEARNSLSIGAHVTWDMHLYTPEQNKIIGILAKNHKPLSLKEIMALSKDCRGDRTYQNRIKQINEKSSAVQIIRDGAGPAAVYRLVIQADGGQPKLAAS